MECRIVTNNNGENFELTEMEEKYMRAIERLEKMPSGRLYLFGNGKLSIRINEQWYKDEIYLTSIFCEGGDGGDDY
ncbi:MAG: hypothetical protein PEPC_01805 [Peptostreptococcus russellii]